MKTVLILQPGFPAEIPYYVRGLARRGARVLGVGDQPTSALPAVAKEGLHAYLQVGKFWHAPSLIDAINRWDLPLKLDRVECLWEAGMELAAEVRAAFRLPGLNVDETLRFRDKHVMRRLLDAAGIRNPRYAKASTAEEIIGKGRQIGFPLIIKPAAGAGSANTYRVDNEGDLLKLLPVYRNTSDVVLEEFIEGTEFTFDTICANGEILFYNILRYQPTMLESRSNEWVSPQNMILRDLQAPAYRAALKLGRDVIRALGFRTGITHMEWFLKKDGEVVFGEIAARPPGGMTGELMNYSCDFDIYEAWGQALLEGRITQNLDRKYNVGMIFKRAQGQGRIQRIEGLEDIYRKFGPHILRHELVAIGESRRDWKQTLLSDGFVILRHPDLGTATAMSAYVAENLKLYAA